jgi:hypothetical protein
MLLCVGAILAAAVPRWVKYWKSGRAETIANIRIDPASA